MSFYAAEDFQLYASPSDAKMNFGEQLGEQGFEPRGGPSRLCAGSRVATALARVD